MPLLLGPPPSDHLAQAKVCYDEADFQCASQALAEARKSLGSLDVGKQVEVLALSAAVKLFEQQEGQAEQHLAALLKLRHNFRPEGWKPAWIKVLERVRRTVPDTAPPEVAVTSPMGPREGEPVTFKVDAWDAGGVDRVQLTVASGEPVQLAFSSNDGLAWLATLPGAAVGRGGLDVWIEAWDKAGNKSAWGTKAAPQHVAVSPNWAAGAVGKASPKAVPIVEQWWFWTIIGVVVVGTAVGLGVGLSQGQASPPGGIEATWSF